MIVTVRNINKEIYKFEVNEESSVKDLKQLIHDKYNHQPSWLVLIFSGKILEDDKPLSTYNITESGFIVMMIKKPKETTAETTTPTTAPNTTPQPQTNTTPVTTTTPVTPTPTPTTASTPNTSTTTPTPATNTSPQTNSFVTGPELEGAIATIESMGFPRDQAIRALRATYNNPDRAVEYLLNGGQGGNDEVDDQFEDEPNQGGNGGGENRFEALRNHPQFPVLREAISRNPNILPQLLNQLAQTNPELVRQISENPQEFIRIFQEGGNGGNGGGGGGGNHPGQISIQVTPEESEAIERLQNLTGFDKSQVIQAYFACDKNEDLTASYLFEHGEEDDD